MKNVKYSGLNVIIVPQNTDLNKGDQCLNVNAVKLLESHGYNIKVVEAAGAAEEILLQKHQTQEIINLIPNPMRHPSRDGKTDGMLAVSKQIANGIGDAIIYFFSAFGPKFISEKLHPEFVEELKKADLVLAKGGGFYHSSNGIRGIYYLFYVSYLLLLAQRHGCKISFLPNSIGPFNGWWDNILAKIVLGRCEKIYVREEFSLKYLSSIGINATPAPDLAFLNPPKTINESSGQIGITVRPWRGVSEDVYDNYLSSIERLVRENSQDEFLFIAQSFGPSQHEDDRVAISLLVNRLSDCTNFKVHTEELYYEDMINLYGSLNLLIATRFHSALFAYSTGVPAITVAYSGFKAQGIMRDMGMERYSFEMKNITYDSLLQSFRELKQLRSEVSEHVKRQYKKLHDEVNNVRF